MTTSVLFGRPRLQPGRADAGPAGTERKPSAGEKLRRFLLAALILAMPVNRVFVLSGKRVNMAASDPILLIGFFFLIWQLLSNRLRLPLFPVFCLSISSIAFSTLYNLEISLLSKGAVGMVVEFAKFAFLWLHFYLVVNLLSSRRDFLLLLRMWVIGSALVALSGVGGSLAYQLTGIENEYALMYRAHGTLGDSNLFAAHLALSFFLTLLYRRLSGRKSIWTLPIMLLQMAGIFFSASRGSTLSFVLCLVMFWALIVSWRAKLAGAVLAGGLLLCVFLLPDRDALLSSNPITARLATTTVSLGATEAADRRQLWELALLGFYQSPIFGLGRGNFAFLRPPSTVMAEQAHNTYLGILCETGIVGLTSYFIFVGYFGFALIRSGWLSADKNRRTLTGLLLVGLLMIALGGMTISIENYRGLWILIAVLEAYKRLFLAGPRPLPSPRGAGPGEFSTGQTVGVYC